MQGVDCRRVGWAARGPCAWFTLISRFQVSTAAPGLGPRQRRALVANNASAKSATRAVTYYLEVLGVSRITITGGAYPSVPAPWQDGWFSPYLVNSPKFTACVSLEPQQQWYVACCKGPRR
ncbi:hypothetical protein GE21DRAFT_1285089 [Neurospora crassa]|nr:hypothetical protein GE21DRAFT_1285089 [Neurospora crassa]